MGHQEQEEQKKQESDKLYWPHGSAYQNDWLYLQSQKSGGARQTIFPALRAWHVRASHFKICSSAAE